jgi:thioredoxin-related protein
MQSLLKIILLILFSITVINANETINIDKTIKIAQKENKHLMIFFHIPHCPYCIRMLNKNFKDKQIVKEIKNNFILLDLYTKDDFIIKFNDFKGTIKEFANFIGATAYPATLFIDKNKKVIHKAIGYRNINELLSEMKYISTNSYKIIDLESFILKLEFDKDD